MNYTTNCSIRNVGLGSIPKPAETYMMCDAPHMTTGDTARVAFANVCGINCNTQYQNPNYARHNGGENVAYADGHVKWLNSMTIWGYRNNANLFAFPQ